MTLLKHLSLVVIVGFVVSACAPKDEKTTVIKERQASENLAESMQLTSGESTLVIQKSALGKAFLMTPSLVLSKRTPDFNDFKPQIISFERSASRLGMFRLSSNNLYSSIPTDKLLQTFRIVKETSEALTIDISEGFRNISFEEHLSIVERDTIDQQQSVVGEGYEVTADIKEALIRKSEMTDNTMYIEQAVRFGSLPILESEEEAQASQALSPFQVALTAKVIIEIKPYVMNQQFKSQLFDKTQRVGFFINFATLAEQEEALPQIVKWDISEKRAPIVVALEENIPAEISEAVAEGVTYWNKVIGREVLTILRGFKATDRVSDRMIIIRWVHWDSAGFAYASMQADPMTGEILRAQVFMTSSWLKMQQAELAAPIAGKAAKNKSGLCVMEQSAMQTAQSLTNLSSAHKLKFAQDTIRMVVAHEMGHVMGLRHNFAGSFNHEGSDEELLKAQSDYLANENHTGFPLSSTVMDYERGLHTAMLGAQIKHSVLPYDSAAIGWGYKDQKIELAKNTYCSDEHIAIANQNNAVVYGCERFDALKNPTLGAQQSVQSALDNVVSKKFRDLLSIQHDNDPYEKTPKVEESADLLSVQVNLRDLENILFTQKDKTTVISIDTALSSFQSSYSMKGDLQSEYSIESKMFDDLKSIGGLTGLISNWLKLSSQSNGAFQTIQNQVADFFTKLDAAQSGFEQNMLIVISNKMLESAKKEDEKLLSTVMVKFVPVYKGNYNYKTIEEYKDAQKNPDKYPAPIMRYRSGVKLGDAKLLMSLFKEAILSGKDAAKKVTVNGQELEIQLLSYSNYNRDTLIKAFVLENWPTGLHSEMKTSLLEQSQQLKEALAANTLVILKALGKSVPALTSAELIKAVKEITYSQMSGIYAFELERELAVLEKLENAKPE
ncbi:MAG: zinc-dependent metalloprotease [Bdellovibrionota bacterium]